MLASIFIGVAAAGIVVTLADITRAWSALPDQVPMRFNLDGSPGRTRSRWLLYLIVAPLALGVLALAWSTFETGATRGQAAIAGGLTLSAAVWFTAWVIHSTIEVATGKAKGLRMPAFWLAFAGLAAVAILAMRLS
jgi:hypothetical protein